MLERFRCSASLTGCKRFRGGKSEEEDSEPPVSRHSKQLFIARAQAKKKRGKKILLLQHEDTQRRGETSADMSHVFVMLLLKRLKIGTRAGS